LDWRIIVLSFVAIWALAGCAAPATQGLVTMRVGYFPNITHSQALVGVARGEFSKALGPDVTLDAKVFNAGPSVIEAMFAGQLDLSYIGPNPAINGYVKSNGQALRVMAGATSAGAAHNVRPDANNAQPQDLAGKNSPARSWANTQMWPCETLPESMAETD
jgi:NitT/TauT family transport system substrate-binding protein